MKEKIIINVQPVHNSVEHLIREGQYLFKGNNGYWPTVCLVGDNQFNNFLQFYWQMHHFKDREQPIGNSFVVKMESIELRIILCHAVKDDTLQFH